MKFSYYHFILALEAASLVSTIMPSAVYAQKSGHLRNRRDIITSPPEYSVTTTTNNDLRRLSNTQSCTLGLEDVLPLFDAPHSSIKDHVFTCVMDPEDEDSTYHPGHMFDLDMDADDEESLKKLLTDGTINLGQSKLDVQGLEYDEEKIFIPKGWDIASKISNGTKKSPPWKSNRLRRHAQDNNIYEDRNLKTGDRKVLVVKVVTPEVRDPIYGNVTCAASQRPESPAEISSIIFGEGPTGIANSNVNMKDQLSACSFDKLNMIPTDGDDPINAPGVITLDIEVSLCNHRNRFRDDAKLKLEEKLGRPVTEVYDHVIFLMEKCVQNCGWAAFAGSNSWYSFYQNINYKIPAVVMHELGHNFNLAHSGGLDGSKYTDKTGFMGNPAHAPGARYAGNLCYDAAKSWQLGWYNDRDLTLYPENEPSNWGTVKTMVGIANYDQATSNTPVLIKLETGLAEDYFINFNRATGINQQNVQADDEVTIVKANADTKSQSYLQATLPENESHTIVGLGKANGIVVKLLSIDKTDPDLWKAEVFIGTDQATLPGPTTPQPTRSPSKSPTLSPSASPSGSPSRSPSTSPTQSPSASPSQSPSLSPSKGPSKAPQLNPTTASPSTSPSVHPSKAPSDSPSDQPSSQPTTSMPTLSSSSMAPTLSPTTPAPIVTKEPTSSPSSEPTSSPSRGPTASPSQSPSASPSQSPTMEPTSSPSHSPTLSPTDYPTASPSHSPTKEPSLSPTLSPTKYPTQSPTTESPTYGSTPVQQHYTACGSSRQSCAGRTELADAEELHEVRCCSDTDLGNGWNKRSGCDVWGESHINGVCHRGKTYTEAVDICTSVGARLCTAQELLDDCPRGTGCNFDREMNWSSTPGIEQEVTEYEYEAEYYSSGSGVSVKTTHAGYTGSGFVDYGGTGTYIEINNVNGGSGGVCSISTNYANGGTWTRRCKVSVNGVDQPGELSYPPTGAWNKWADSNTLQVNCNPGTSNTIRITGTTSGPNMNKMMVSVP